MKTVPWQPGFTWRKLGYLTNSNSLSYREVINDNPGWDVVTEPPLGAMIRLSMNSFAGATEGIGVSVNSLGGLTSKEFYPFYSLDEYTTALTRYPPSSLMNVERFNGWSMDSLPAVTGAQ